MALATEVVVVETILSSVGVVLSKDTLADIASLHCLVRAPTPSVIKLMEWHPESIGGQWASNGFSIELMPLERGLIAGVAWCYCGLDEAYTLEPDVVAILTLEPSLPSSNFHKSIHASSFLPPPSIAPALSLVAERKYHSYQQVHYLIKS